MINNFEANYNKILKILHLITEKEQFLRQNRKPKLKDIELIAINLTSEYMSIDSECQLFRVLPEILKSKIERTVFNRRKRKLFFAMEFLRNQLCDKLIKFLIMIKNSQYNGVPAHLIYGTLISSTGNYTLRFTGNVDNNLARSINSLKKAEDYEKDYKLYIKDKGKEKGFLHFLKDFIKVDDIKLYRIRDNGDVEEKTLKNNGKVNTNDCE